MNLVLSSFPGIDMLGRAFEEHGFCVVRGPDVLSLHRNSSFDSAFSRWPRAAERFRYLVHTQSLAKQSKSLLGVHVGAVGSASKQLFALTFAGTLRDLSACLVFGKVNSPIANFQILDSVIILDAIQMMDVLIGEKGSSKMGFYNDPMLKTPVAGASVDFDISSPRLFSTAATVKVIVLSKTCLGSHGNADRDEALPHSLSGHSKLCRHLGDRQTASVKRSGFFELCC